MVLGGPTPDIFQFCPSGPFRKKQLTYSCKVASKKTGVARLSSVDLLMQLQHAVPINHTMQAALSV